MDKQNIETIYPLAPLQQAFLWHSLQTSSHAGLIHMRCTLRGALDPNTLKLAWESIISSHPALRTSVHWESVKQPLQVVARHITLPWSQLDWRHLEDPQSALNDFLATDRDRGFDLTQAPIMRLAVIRLTETDYELVWSCHHLMVDGWSGVLVLNQVMDCYDALRQNQPLPTPDAPSYQAYIRWLKQQDQTAAAEFWRETLQGFGKPTPLPVSLIWKAERKAEGRNEKAETRRQEAGVRNQESGVKNSPTSRPPRLPASPSLTLPPDATAQLQDCLRSRRLTLNTLLQGVWALLLYSYSGEADVLFGATVSGRQGNLAGVDVIVGLLVNVLPVRVQVRSDETVLDWLQRLQIQQAATSRYAYASPAQIQAWSEFPGRLFDSLLVIENYPVQTVKPNRCVQVDNVQSGIVSAYGLTVIIKPGEALTLMLQTADQCFEGEILNTLLNQFEAVLMAIIENPVRSIREILPLMEGAIASNQTSSMQPALQTPPNLSREELEGWFFSPRNPLELKLTEIWESVLGVRPLSIDASFFDLGGNSLLAVQLFNQMQQELNCTLPLSSLFQAPNVHQFAALLSQDQPASQWSSLAPIQLSGFRLPFFFHGGSADALTWARFSHLLGTERPFYALQRPDLSGGEVIHITVEALASACIQEMRMVQPSGPYLVGGHCLGGAVAFEIAQQLQSQGEEIVSVILIDAYRPESLPETVLTQLQTQLRLGVFWLRKNYYYHGGWEKLAQLPGKVWRRLQPSLRSLNPLSIRNTAPPRPDRLYPDLEGRETPPNYSSAANSADRSASLPQNAEPTIPYEYRYARAQEANERAAEQYIPQPYSGRIKLFRANIQILDWYFGAALGWQTVAKDAIEITQIPGFFGNLFNQQSGPLLAEQVKTYLSTLK